VTSWWRLSSQALARPEMPAPTTAMRCLSFMSSYPFEPAEQLGVGRVVVDGLEVLRSHLPFGDARLAHQAQRDVAHQVLDELRVVVGALGHPLFVGRLSRPKTSQDASSSARRTSSSMVIGERSFASSVMCERWLWAP
jgi:hypothetical protein